MTSLLHLPPEVLEMIARFTGPHRYLLRFVPYLRDYSLPSCPYDFRKALFKEGNISFIEKQKIPFLNIHILLAVKYGRYEVIKLITPGIYDEVKKLAIEHNHPRFLLENMSFDYSDLELSTKYNNNQISDFLLEKGITPSYNTFCHAAYNGNISFLSRFKEEVFASGGLDLHAASGGRTDVLDFLLNIKYLFNTRISCSATESKKLAVLKWVERKGMLIEDFCAILATRNGDLDILKWLEKRISFEYGYLIQVAIEENHSFLVSWLGDKVSKEESYYTLHAARFLRFDLMKLLLEKGFPWHKTICTYLMKNGDLSLLQWAIENGCPWNNKALTVALTEGHYDLFRWAYKQGCPKAEKAFKNIIYSDTLTQRDYEMIRWGIENDIIKKIVTFTVSEGLLNFLVEKELVF